jgi:hypothetical protein
MVEAEPDHIFHLLPNGMFDITSAGQPPLVTNVFGIDRDSSFRDSDRAGLGDGVLDVFSIPALNGGPRTSLYDSRDVLAHRAASRDRESVNGV